MAATKIAIRLSSKDQDIIDWFNLITSRRQSKSRWIGALLIAYSKGELISIDSSKPAISNINKPASEEDVDWMPLAKPKDSKKNSSTKGAYGEYIPGCSIQFTLSNKKSINAFNVVKREGFKITTVIKGMIREGFKIHADDFRLVYNNLNKYFQEASDEEFLEKLRKRVENGESLEGYNQEKPMNTSFHQKKSVKNIHNEPYDLEEDFSTDYIKPENARKSEELKEVISEPKVFQSVMIEPEIPKQENKKPDMQKTKNALLQYLD